MDAVCASLLLGLTLNWKINERIETPTQVEEPKCGSENQKHKGWHDVMT